MADTTSHGIHLFICIIAFTVICMIFLLLRLWAARLSRRSFYLDDFAVVFAFANTLALSGVLFWLIFNGMGKHIADTTPYELGITFQVVTAAYVCWTLGTGAVKLSMVLLYTRIFRTAQFRRCAYVLMGAIAAFTVAFFVVFLTNCEPVSEEWKPVPGGHCRAQSPSEFASVSSSLAIDLAIIILPFPWLWKLKMPLRNKITVSVTLSIGFATISVMIWRIPVTVQSTKDNDFTYHLFTIGLITMLELWLGVIAACIPTLAPILHSYGKPAFNKIAKTFKSSSSGTPSKGSGDSGGNQVATIGGSGGVQNFYMASSSHTELGDSQEAINLGVEQDGRHQDITALTATPWTQTTTSKGLGEGAPIYPPISAKAKRSLRQRSLLNLEVIPWLSMTEESDEVSSMSSATFRAVMSFEEGMRVSST